jgi:hypothetical protein
MREYSRVRVLATKPDGSPHPHAGKTGVVLEVMSLFDPPKAQVKIDPGFEMAGNIMVVSLSSLEKI